MCKLLLFFFTIQNFQPWGQFDGDDFKSTRSNKITRKDKGIHVRTSEIIFFVSVNLIYSPNYKERHRQTSELFYSRVQFYCHVVLS